MVNTKKFSQLNVGTTPSSTDIFAMSQNLGTTPISTQISASLYAQYLNTLFLQLTGGTLTGPLFLPTVTIEPGDQPGPTQVIPYSGVQVVASSAAGAKELVFAGTTNTLDATYASGPDSENPGIGATITANSNQVLIIDGVPFDTFQEGLRVAIVEDISNDPNDLAQGIYIIQQAGIADPGGQPYILVRSADFDNSDTGKVLNGCLVYVLEGDTYGDKLLIASLADFSVSNPIIQPGIDNFGFFALGELTPVSTIASGFVTLSSGAATVSYPQLSANDGVQVTAQTVSGSQGILSVPTKTPGVGFTLASSNGGDNSVVFWTVLEGQTNNLIKGLATLLSGNATISATSVTSTSVIMLNIQQPIASNGKIVVNSITPGTGFTITSGYGFDASVISWAIYDTTSPEQNGKVTLSGGSATVSFPSLGAGDIVLITVQSASGTLGDLSVTNKIPGTGFDIISNSALDNSVVGWVVYPSDGFSLSQGLINLLAGSAIVTTPLVQSNSVILMSSQNPSASFGNYAVNYPIVPNASFTIVSNSPIDASQMGWVIVT